MRKTILVLVLLLISGIVYADETHPQRPGFAYDAEIAVPGTLEFQFGTLSTNRMFCLPTTVRYSLDSTNSFLRNSEFAVGFDSLQRNIFISSRKITFSDYLNISFRKRFFEGKRYKFAIAPFATFPTGTGANEYGFHLIGTYERRLNIFVANFAWTTRTIGNNPVERVYQGFNKYNLMFRYGRILGKEGWLSRLSVYGEMMQETPIRHMPSTISLVESVGYQLSESIALDFFVQQTRINDDKRDFQYGVGITINSGYIK